MPRDRYREGTSYFPEENPVSGEGLVESAEEVYGWLGAGGDPKRTGGEIAAEGREETRRVESPDGTNVVFRGGHGDCSSAMDCDADATGAASGGCAARAIPLAEGPGVCGATFAAEAGALTMRDAPLGDGPTSNDSRAFPFGVRFLLHALM